MKGYIYIKTQNDLSVYESNFKDYKSANIRRCIKEMEGHKNVAVFYCDYDGADKNLTVMSNVREYCEKHDIPYGL